MGQHASTEQAIRQYIVEEILDGEADDDLTVSTPLLSTSILDSMAVLKVGLFIEDEFGVVVEPQDVHPEHFDTIERIAQLVHSKSS